jgi:hypothetical protein
MSAAPAVTYVQAWRLVEDHNHVIKRIVGAALARDVIKEQDRDDAIAQGQLLAFELAQRGDVEDFEHLLAYTLPRRFMDKFRPGADAMDRTVEEERNYNSGSRRSRPLRANLTLAEIHRRIDSRIPKRIQTIARMFLTERLSVTKIAHRTGRSQPGPKVELKKIIKYCIRRVSGESQK